MLDWVIRHSSGAATNRKEAALVVAAAAVVVILNLYLWFRPAGGAATNINRSTVRQTQVDAPVVDGIQRQSKTYTLQHVPAEDMKRALDLIMKLHRDTTFSSKSDASGKTLIVADALGNLDQVDRMVLHGDRNIGDFDSRTRTYVIFNDFMAYWATPAVSTATKKNIMAQLYDDEPKPAPEQPQEPAEDDGIDLPPHHPSHK